MGCPRLEYRWPLLCSVSFGDDGSRDATPLGSSGSSPLPDPGDVPAQPMTQIDRGPVQRQLRGRRPELERISVAATAMAIVATQCHVHRETAVSPRPGLVQRTTAVPLH